MAHVQAGTTVIVPLANGEPVGLLDALEQNAAQLREVTVHQMHALHDRPYLHGGYRGQLDHVSYFLSSVTRPPFYDGHVDLVPCHFSEVPFLLSARP
jgi:acyl-CoA hydrolase